MPAMSEDEYRFVEVELVPVAFAHVRFVVEAFRASNTEDTYRFVLVALVVVALVKTALSPVMVVTTRSVIVAATAVSEAMTEFVKFDMTEKSVVDVALVVEALVAKKLVEVA